MWKIILIFGLLIVKINSTPIGHKKKNMAIKSDESMTESESMVNERSELALRTLNLPSNATSIRSDLVDNFSCEDKGYGYYADIDNDCQIFHVCLPVVYPDGKENLFRWSFICPEETVFSQDSFTCMREEDMAIGCEDSMKYYELNRNFGMITESNEMIVNSYEDDMNSMPIVTPSESKMNENDKVNKLDVIQKKPSNKKKPNRRPEYHSKQPIRKISTTTTKILDINNEMDIVTEKEMEKTSNNKYQRFTKRPDILSNNNQKKKNDEIKPAFKLEQNDKKQQQQQQQQLQQSKKPILQQLILNTKTFDIPENSRITNIIEQDNKNIVTENILIETKIPLDIVKINDEIKLPLKNQNQNNNNNNNIDETSLIKNINLLYNDDNDQLSSQFTVITTENSILNDITESLILIKNQEQNPIKDEEKINFDKLLIKTENISSSSDNINKNYDEQQQQEENNEQKIFESMNDDIKISNNNIEKDQQSMIINLISSLVNAENLKVEESENDMENLKIEETKTNLNSLNLQKNPVKFNEALKENENEQVQVQEQEQQQQQELKQEQEITENIKLQSELHDELVNNDNNNNNNNNNMKIFDQMSHIPVKIISDDMNFDSILNLNNNKDEIIEATTLSIIENNLNNNNNGKELFDDILENVTKLPITENINDSTVVTVKTNEILPIFFRTNNEDSINQIMPIDNKKNDNIVEINQNPLNINTKIDNLKANLRNQNQMDSRKRRFLFRADATS